MANSRDPNREPDRIRKDEEQPLSDWEIERKRDQTIDRFERCPRHGTVYPAGGSCPKC
jgi:hypothetical protein